MTPPPKFLHLWFAAFPVWSTVYYAWFIWLIIRAGGHVTPFAIPDSPQHVSVPMFATAFVCFLFVAGTVLGTVLLVERRIPGKSSRWYWILLALAIPPLGCPLAYFRTRSESMPP
jgi:hypothetical protein